MKVIKLILSVIFINALFLSSCSSPVHGPDGLEKGNVSSGFEEENAAADFEESSVPADFEEDNAPTGTGNTDFHTDTPQQSDPGYYNSCEESNEFRLGDERTKLYLPILEGKRIALYSNASGIVGAGKLYRREQLADPVVMKAFEKDLDIPFSEIEPSGKHILDVLLENGIDVEGIFSPEHGFRGDFDAGRTVDDSIDEKTGIPIYSLYGAGDLYSRERMESFDTLVVDIQDVGVRFYTYYITMFNLMNACAKYDKEVVILDRPNPNGFYVDGPVLKDGFRSGVGVLPIPVVHGLTLGEMAMLISSEGWLEDGAVSSLTVIPCSGYHRNDLYMLEIAPSPNLKNMRAVYLYPSICLFENSLISVGRGTEHPFEIFGCPFLKGQTGYGYSFTPVDMTGAHDPQYSNIECFGRQLADLPTDEIISGKITVGYLTESYRILKEICPEKSFFGNPYGNGKYWIDYLAGTDTVRQMTEEGKSENEIESSWKDDVEGFKKLTSDHLIYE